MHISLLGWQCILLGWHIQFQFGIYGWVIMFLHISVYTTNGIAGKLACANVTNNIETKSAQCEIIMGTNGHW